MGVIRPQVNGAALIQVSFGSNSSFFNFGYTVNGAKETEEGLAVPVYCDVNGGDQGQPIDWQDMGSIGRISLEMATWDEDIEMRLRGRRSGGIAGKPGNVGRMIVANREHFGVQILGVDSSNRTIARRWPCCTTLRAPISVQVGTIWSRLQIDFECIKHPDTGILYERVYA